MTLAHAKASTLVHSAEYALSQAAGIRMDRVRVHAGNVSVARLNPGCVRIRILPTAVTVDLGRWSKIVKSGKIRE